MCAEQRMSKPKKDLTNMKIGRLTPIYWVKGGKWMCRCDCGNEVLVDARNLHTHGGRKATQSCGCLQREMASHLTYDMNGYEDDNLIVIEREHSDKQGVAKWRCICKHCGNIFITRGSSIRRGYTQSCGCVHSNNERIITKMLTDANAEFSTQYTFDDLKGVNGGALRFDFAVFHDHRLHHLIEYNGLQHYEKPKGKWEYMYDTLIKHDAMKREYCKAHNIELRIIPQGTDYKIEDLL